MIIFCCIFIGILVFAKVLIATLSAHQFKKRCSGQAVDSHSVKHWPKAAILVSLRGADPKLTDAMKSLMVLDYPDYEIHIVVDSRDDPAWQCAEEAIHEIHAKNVQLQELTERRTTCGLKCSALVQAASRLDESFDVLVIADADVRTHSEWLKQLVQPFEQEDVGATYGNRWFRPRHIHVGSAIRYLWNAAAVVHMHRLNIPWGGSLAIRMSSFREADILEKWKTSITDDTLITSALESIGQRGVFVPQLMMINQEECDLGYSIDFIKRQLTWTRLYHPGWSRLLAFTSLIAFIQSGMLFLGIWALWNWNLHLLGFVALLYSVYFLALWVGLAEIEKGIHKISQNRNETIPAFSPATFLIIVVCTPLAELVHIWAMVRASLSQSVVWRGVKYRLSGPWNVHMVDYSPYKTITSRDHSI